MRPSECGWGSHRLSEQQPPAALLLWDKRLSLTFHWDFAGCVLWMFPPFSPSMPLSLLLCRLPTPSSQPQGNPIVLLDLLQFVHDCDTGSPRCGPETAEQMETIPLLGFLLTEHSALQCHKPWSLSHPARQLRPGVHREAPSPVNHWMSELGSSLEEPARPQSDFPGCSQQEQLQLDADTMPRH